MKRFFLAVILVYVTWTAMDMVIHGMILMGLYEQTSHLWRPMNEMKVGLMHLITLLSALFFTGIFGCLVQPKSIKTGLRYGLGIGLLIGLGMGWGSYSYLPIPKSLAWGWMLGAIAETLVGGVIVGWLVKTCPCPMSCKDSGTCVEDKSSENKS